MTDATFLSEIEEELYLCEKLAMVVSETGVSNEQIDDDDIAKHFRAVGTVSQHLASKLLALRCRMDELEVANRANVTTKSANRTAAQKACDDAHQAVREIESPVATLEQQMILFDMAIETMMGSRSTETAGAGLSNLQGAMNSSIKGINRTWTAAHEATKLLTQSAQTAKGEGNV